MTAETRLAELRDRAENGEFCLNCSVDHCPSNEILAICTRALRKPTESTSAEQEKR